MRTIEYHFNQTDLQSIIDKTSAEEVQKAVYHLSTWAADAYPKVSVFGTSVDGEFTAVYYKPDGSRGFVMGAVWHGDHFGFHS